MYDVSFCPTLETSIAAFGGHYVPISAMLERARQWDAPVLILNSDIELSLSPWEMKRIRWIADDGLCYFVRYNHNGNKSRSTREPFGIDGFLLHSRACHAFSESILSMGQPFWDYWLPYTVAQQGLPVFSVEFPAAFHKDHPRQWTWANYVLCAREFDRMTGALRNRPVDQACMTMSQEVRQCFDNVRTPLPVRPPHIREWMQAKFHDTRPRTFIELGAHTGSDTAWMAQISGVTLYALEPDPRNQPPQLPNVVLYRAAISDRDGTAQFILSKHGWGQEWTHSSSLKRPKNHLSRYPVTFGETIEVQALTLDTLAQSHGLQKIDFIWADIQGAEEEMIRGGSNTLAKTHYLFTEYSDDELYEGQPTLSDILKMLPDFRVLELWPDEVLLENRKYADRDSHP